MRGSRGTALHTSPPIAAVHGVGSGGGAPAAWTWGGSAVENDGWHLYFSFLVNGCGLLHYQTNSVVQHVVSTRGPQGPFTWQGTALAPRAGQWDSSAIHGPSVHFDGTTSHGRHSHVKLQTPFIISHW